MTAESFYGLPLVVVFAATVVSLLAKPLRQWVLSLPFALRFLDRS